MILPTPNEEAKTHSGKLTQLIRREIEKSGGYINFARFMELALYAPGMGYYSAGSFKLGKEGDFITAPEISPLFAQCIASQCQQVLAELNGGDILEIGGGTGVFAKDLLLELDKRDQLPNNYYILDVSADLRARQKKLIKFACPELFHRVKWLDSLPRKISGVIFANEVLDAMPVHCFSIDEAGIQERGVKWDRDRFRWHFGTPGSALNQRIQALQKEFSLPTGYTSEVNLTLTAWIQTLSNLLKKGLMLFIDYGYGRAEYYHPERSQGTLSCFYQHYHHDDPFALVGLQDITAHVDFTTVAESATAAGLTLAGYATQESFLFACGLIDLANELPLSAKDQYQQSQAIKKLTLPSQMGELVKVMGLTKEMDPTLSGFSLRSRKSDL